MTYPSILGSEALSRLTLILRPVAHAVRNSHAIAPLGRTSIRPWRLSPIVLSLDQQILDP
jgi:hypothetical protein